MMVYSNPTDMVEHDKLDRLPRHAEEPLSGNTEVLLTINNYVVQSKIYCYLLN